MNKKLLKMSRKQYCVGDCDFKNYYSSQAGQGFSDITIFRGNPYQRGYGIGSVFRRFGIPLARFLGKHLLNTGLAIGTDIAMNNSIDRQSVKRKLTDGVKSAAKDGLSLLNKKIDQIGNGRKVYKKKRKKMRKDIFS